MTFKPSRRHVLAATAATSLMATPALARPVSPLRLWYNQPAARWEDALPVGNGRLGAMVFGRVGQERLQLNEDTLWAGSPYTPDNPEARAALPEVRRLIAAGRFAEATELASAKVMAKPLWQMAYGTLGDLFLSFPGAIVPDGYQRDLDLETAIAATEFHIAGRRVRREVFASAPDQIIVAHMTAETGGLGFDLGYRGPRKADYIAPDYQGAAALPPPAEIDWLGREDITAAPVTMVADGPDAVLITGRNEASAGIPAGLTWAVRIKVVSDGQVTIEDGALKLRNGRFATVLIAAGTSFVRYDDISGDPLPAVRTRTEQAAAKGIGPLRHDHIADYRALFAGVTLDLGTTSSSRLATDERIRRAETSDDPGLSVLYLQYARYLLIASSRPGSQPANLQGIWNEGTNPPWGSKYTININTEMNYWPAGPLGLGPCVEPLVRMVEELSVTGAKTARTMYGASGWVTHHNTDIWRAAAPIDGPLWGLWPCGGAWLCNSLWDHYDYGRDLNVLARIEPLLAGASAFFLDTLIEDPDGRGLVTSPSISPENQHPFGSSVCAGPAMDRQIVRDLFANTLAAHKTLRREGELTARIAAARARLAPDAIGKSGQLQEWLNDWDGDAPEQHHRHVSHLYGVYPSGQINVRDTPALTQAARVTLSQRGDLATGWGTAWRLCLWARLGEGDHAHTILKALTGPQRTYPNMFDAHPPFQIDGNFGGAAGIMEMLLQSWGDEVILLPALPSAWPSGRVSGVRARGGIKADFDWSGGRLTSLRLSGPAGAAVALRIGGKLKPIRLDARGRYRLKA